MPNEVNLTCTLNKEYLPATGQPQLAYVLMEVVPTQAMAAVQMPLNLSLVLDKSGSMDGAKMTCLKEAVKRVIDLLGPDDFISVVAFDSSPKTLVKSQQAASAGDKQNLKRQVDRLSAGGGTEIAPAMDAGLGELQRAFAPNYLNRLVLLTDGQSEHEDRCRKQAQKQASLGIPMLALGIGADWNEQLLLDLAAATGGQADYIASAPEIAPYFQNTVQAMQATVVQNAELVLRLVAGINPRKIWRVVPVIADLGYRPLSDRVVAAPLGELETGQGQALLVELMLPPRPSGVYRIAQAEVAYDAPLLGLTQEKVRADIMMSFTQDAFQAQQVNPRVMNIVEKVTAFKLQTRALQEAEAGNIANATQQLRAAHTILLSQGDTELAKTVRLAADELEKQNKMSSEAQKTIRFGSGKTVRLDAPEQP
jgi:Ca-activated chloride channel family protein